MVTRVTYKSEDGINKEEVNVTAHGHDGGSPASARIELALGLLRRIREEYYPNKIKIEIREY